MYPMPDIDALTSAGIWACSPDQERCMSPVQGNVLKRCIPEVPARGISMGRISGNSLRSPL